MAEKATRRRPGRPRTGEAGDRLEQHPLVRLAPSAKADLERLAAERGVPQWRLLTEAVQVLAAVEAARRTGGVAA